MCGITGAVWTDAAKRVERDTLVAMTDALRHRGPDDEGFYETNVATPGSAGTSTGVALGHRRLSIIDVAGGHQPLSNEDGSVWIVFNGEIYNFRDLRRRLDGAGHHFQTSSDTETLVHLYEDLGVGFLEHVEGMFALAIWDGRRRQLVLARDRLGKKPLVYREEPGRLLFASELKSLLQVPDVPRDIDPAALDEYLAYQYVPHPHTIFRGMRKLPPAHYAVYRDGRLDVGCYWRPDFTREVPRSAGEYSAELRELLTRAVEKRLQSEVPLGAFLSGGIDSSIVVALAQQLTREPVKTFSIGFPIAEYDETSYAREVARHLGTDHHEERVEPDCIEILPKLMWHFDEPFADSSAIPTYYVSQMTRRHVTVALSGDGGDELFAGYTRYRAVQLASLFDRLPAPLRKLIANNRWQRLPSSLRQRSLVRRFKRFMEGLGESDHRRYFDWMSIFNERQRAALYSESFVAQLPDADPFDFLETAFAPHRRARSGHGGQPDRSDHLSAVRPDDEGRHCIDGARAGMPRAVLGSASRGTGGRDAGRAEIAARRRQTHLARDIRAAVAEVVADALEDGFRRAAFALVRHELRDFAREVLLDPSTLARGYFQPAAVERLVAEHLAGTFDHGFRLWSLLVFELWQRQWVDAALLAAR